MAVVRLMVHDREDPNGDPLGEITDADLKAFSMRVPREKYESGSGLITMNRHNALADLLDTGALVRAYIPVIHASTAVFAFWLDEAITILLAGQPDRASENITIGGLGRFDYVRRALLDATQAGSGSFAPAEGQWRGTGLAYTDLLGQMIDEDAATVHPALPDLTYDFTPTLDSDGNPSPTMDDEYAVDIGTDYAAAFRTLALTDDDFELLMHAGSTGTPQLRLGAFASLGTDRTGTDFGPGIVRFVAPGNMLTELTRRSRGLRRGTHALVGGKDGAYRLVVRAGWAPPEPVRRIFVPAPGTKSPAVMDRIGQRALNERTSAQDLVDLEFTPGDDEDNGLYLPLKHFNPGDLVTLHTGHGFRDYVDHPLKVHAWRLALADAVDDTSAETAYRSLKMAVELGTTGAGSGPAGLSCCEGPGSQHTPPVCDCGTPIVSTASFCNTTGT